MCIDCNRSVNILFLMQDNIVAGCITYSDLGRHCPLFSLTVSGLLESLIGQALSTLVSDNG